MNSLITTTTIRDVTIPTIGATFAAIAVVLLIASLVARELSRALDPRLSSIIEVLKIVIPPLLIVFVAVAATRLRGAV